MIEPGSTNNQQSMFICIHYLAKEKLQNSMKILKVKIRVIAGSASPYGYSTQALSQPNEISEKPKPFFPGLFNKLQQQRSSNDSVHEGDAYKQITGHSFLKTSVTTQ